MNLVNLINKSKMAGLKLFHSHKMIYCKEINKYKICFGVYVFHLYHKSFFRPLFCHTHIREKSSAFQCPRWVRKNDDFFTDNCFGYKTRKTTHLRSKKLWQAFLPLLRQRSLKICWDIWKSSKIEPSTTKNWKSSVHHIFWEILCSEYF